MNETHMRDALLATEQPSPELESRYRERLRAISERRITTLERVVLVIGMLGALATAAWIVRLFVTHVAEGRPVGLVGLLVGFAFSVGYVVFVLMVLRRGVEQRVWHNLLLAQLTGGFTLALVGLMLWDGLNAHDPARGNRSILFGLVFWTTIGLPFYIAQWMRENEMRIRTDLLRLELALARHEEARS